MTVTTAIKVRENKLRRLAERRGYRLTKRRRRDPTAIDAGLFALIDIQTNKAVNPPLAGFIHSWTLGEVEAYLVPWNPQPKSHVDA